MDNKQSKDITITGVEIKNGRYKIFDQDRMWYAFFKTKQDGSKSSAYEQWESMGLDQGSAVNVSFVAEEKEYQGKPFTDRKVIWFRETNGKLEGTKTAPQAKSPRISQNNASQGQSDDYWDKKAYKQCLWAYFLQKGKPLLQVDADLVWNEFKSIEKDAEARFNPLPVRKAVEKANPQFFNKAEEGYVGTPFFFSKDPLPDDPTNGEMNPMVNDEPPLEDGPGFGDEEWKFQQ